MHKVIDSIASKPATQAARSRPGTEARGIQIGRVRFEGIRGLIFLGIVLIGALALWPLTLGLFLGHQARRRIRQYQLRVATLAVIALLALPLSALWVQALWLGMSPQSPGSVEYTMTRPAWPSSLAWFASPLFAADTPVRQATVASRVAAVTEDGLLVTKVIDGHTIMLENGAIVRYLGVDTREPFPCLTTPASTKNQALVVGQRVRLEQDVHKKTDEEGRLLRYVYVGDILINELLVREGFAAAVLAETQDSKYQERLRAAEHAARQDKWGLWSQDCAPTPTPAAQRSSPRRAVPDNESREERHAPTTQAVNPSPSPQPTTAAPLSIPLPATPKPSLPVHIPEPDTILTIPAIKKEDITASIPL
jgi:endonuclease YncB( thermonuclease family)